MSATGDLPAELQKVIPSLPVECQVKLLELHGRYRFNDDHLDCFTVNNVKLTADNLPAFQHFLEEEFAKSTKQNKAPSSVSKRKSAASNIQSGLALPRGLGAALGRSGAASIAAPVGTIMTTPDSKRMREGPGNVGHKSGDDGPPASGTPDPPTRPLPVSLKSSLNVGNIGKSASKNVQSSVRIEMLGNSKLWSSAGDGTYRWADESLDDRAAARDARLASLEAAVGAAMCERHEGEDVAVGTIGLPAQSEVVLCGRIVCEGLEGRLNERSMLLEGSQVSANGARVQLNVAECRQVAAFTGQIVGVLGRSGMTGTTFHARDFIAGLPPAQPNSSGESPLHMMVVSGPYCLRDSLDFTPLEQTLKHAVRERPQVLIILGPLLDASNQMVCSGETRLPGDDGEVCTYEDIYTRQILPVLHNGLSPLRRSNPMTEVLIVPSLEEVLCFHPLPQPPLDMTLGQDLEGSALEQLQRLGVQFFPNPAHVRINGYRVSLTSVDALTPILREIVLRPEGRKIDEALRLLLCQRTLLPVLPRDPPQVSEARAAAVDFPDGTVPDVCVFPSVTGTATGIVVDETVFVNPGSVCRPAALGSFAEVWLMPGGPAGIPLNQRVRVDIQKLG